MDQTNVTDLERLAREFVFGELAASPTTATQTGLHAVENPNGSEPIRLDCLLDDHSDSARLRRLGRLRGLSDRLGQLDRAGFDANESADYDVLKNALEFRRFVLVDERPHRHRPDFYAENLGSALFACISLDYADRSSRARHLVERLGRTPYFLTVARETLTAANRHVRDAALDSIDGVRALITNVAKDFAHESGSGPEFDAAARVAFDALDRFEEFVRDELAAGDRVDWRAGSEQYRRKWDFELGIACSPEELHAEAVAAVKDVRASMLALALPIHQAWFPGFEDERADPLGSLNRIVRRVLDRIQEDHCQRDEVVARTEQDVAAIAGFLKGRRIISLTDFSNLRVIATPEFMRASFGIAGAVFAPALEPELATYYWITPIPAGWSDTEAEGRLREYNRFKMLQLTVHEALPGHAVQGIYANRLFPEWRRLLRVLNGNVAYIEGWACYSEIMMEREGLTGGDPAAMRLVALKALLRVLLNAIIDIRLHYLGAPEAECLALLLEDGFQERPEAEGKLQRARLDYVQLATYYAGLREFLALRTEFEARLGPAFDLAAFHDRVLYHGPLPVPLIRKLLLDDVEPACVPFPDTPGAGS